MISSGICSPQVDISTQW